LLAVANIGVGDTEAHTYLFSEPRLGDTSLLQMLLDEVTMFFLLCHDALVYLIFLQRYELILSRTKEDVGLTLRRTYFLKKGEQRNL
jgi:hypothetical protein